LTTALPACAAAPCVTGGGAAWLASHADGPARRGAACVRAGVLDESDIDKLLDSPGMEAMYTFLPAAQVGSCAPSLLPPSPASLPALQPAAALPWMP